MANSALTPTQTDFISEIEKQVSTLLSKQLPGTFESVSYPPGFHPAVQFGSPAYYNSTMLDTFNSNLERGSNGMLTLGDQQFATLYYKILTAATYQYSANDKKVVNSPNIANQQVAIQNTATSSGFAAQFSVSPVTYYNVMDALQKNFGSKVVDFKPSTIAAAAAQLGNAGFASLQAAISNGINQLAPLNTILGQQAAAQAELDAAKENAQNPSATNGGLQTGASNYYTGWTPMPSNNVIQAGLDNAGSSVKINITASNLDQHNASFSMSGSGGFSVPILDVIDIGFSASSSYDWSKSTSSSSSIDMTLEYKGVTIVQIDPTPLSADNKTGWYDGSLIDSIVKGSGDDTVSGFKVDPNGQFAVKNMFGTGKPFSRLRTLVVSQQPTITMVFSADQANKVTSAFSQSSHVDVKLFGLFKIGSFDESYSVSNVHQDSASGTVTVTMSPPTIKGTVPPNKQVCNVLGGVALYPS